MKAAECGLFHGWEIHRRALLRCAHWGLEAVVLAGAEGWAYEIGWYGVGGVGRIRMGTLPEAVEVFEFEEKMMAVRHFN